MKNELNTFLAPVTDWTLGRQPENPSLPKRYVLVTTEGVFYASGQLIHATLPEWISTTATQTMYIGCLNAKNIEVVDVSDCIPEHAEIVPLRQALAMASRQEASVLSSASGLVNWNKRYQYCFSCGDKLAMAGDERAKVCSACDTRCYPHVSPCAIMAVKKGRELLLARNSRFKAGRYSVLAGFVESGESAEEAVHREVFEETGIHVKNVQYMGSQAWPFPSQLMLGFICDYDSGEIVLDPHELEEGGWFDIDNLPDMPPSMSISYYLINEAVRQIREQQ